MPSVVIDPNRTWAKVEERLTTTFAELRIGS